MDNAQKELQEKIAGEWQLQMTQGATEKQLTELLATEINRLIQENFSWLVHLLYRIDIAEGKLKTLLRQYPDAAAGRIIAALVIERQKQKMQYRKEHPPGNMEIPDDEKW